VADWTEYSREEKHAYLAVCSAVHQAVAQHEPGWPGLEGKVRAAAQRTFDAVSKKIAPDRVDIDAVTARILSEINDVGDLAALLDDPSWSTIEVYGYDDVRVDGRETDVRLTCEAAVTTVRQNITRHRLKVDRPEGMCFQAKREMRGDWDAFEASVLGASED
jgi:hypothetical protein